MAKHLKKLISRPRQLKEGFKAGFEVGRYRAGRKNSSIKLKVSAELSAENKRNKSKNEWLIKLEWQMLKVGLKKA